jgi:hypothetical protein
MAKAKAEKIFDILGLALFIVVAYFLISAIINLISGW